WHPEPEQHRHHQGAVARAGHRRRRRRHGVRRRDCDGARRRRRADEHRDRTRARPGRDGGGDEAGGRSGTPRLHRRPDREAHLRVGEQPDGRIDRRAAVSDRAPEPLEATLRRLETERGEQDTLYNAALTALDRSFAGAIEVPRPPAPLDDHQVTPLNESWNILPAPPAAAGLRGRLTAFIWRVVGPYLERQLTFNSRLVDHLNRNTASARAAYESQAARAEALHRHL